MSTGSSPLTYQLAKINHLAWFLQVLIDHGCIELCMQSLLRAKLKKKEKGLEGFESPEFRLIMDVIASAMGTLCKSVLAY